MTIPGLLSLRRAGVLGLLIVAALASAVGARAQDSIPPSGSSSGSTSITISVTDLPAYRSPFIGVSSSSTAVLATCPSGNLVVGVTGSRLKFYQKITPLCTTLSKSGSFGPVVQLDPNATGIGTFRLQCDPGHVVTRLRVAYHDNAAVYPYLGGIEIGCTAWLLSQWSGSSQAVSTTNFDSWPLKAAVACNSHAQPVRALRIRATTSVKALSITCDEP